MVHTWKKISLNSDKNFLRYLMQRTDGRTMANSIVPLPHFVRRGTKKLFVFPLTRLTLFFFFADLGFFYFPFFMAGPKHYQDFLWCGNNKDLETYFPMTGLTSVEYIKESREISFLWRSRIANDNFSTDPFTSNLCIAVYVKASKPEFVTRIQSAQFHRRKNNLFRHIVTDLLKYR